MSILALPTPDRRSQPYMLPNKRQTSTLSLLMLLAGSALSARDWMGVKRPQPAAPAPGDSASRAAPSPPAPKPRPKADTSWLSRTVRSIPAGSPGVLLGMLEGVRCFNCEPGIVHLNLGDTSSREAGFLSLRIDIWNAIERPLRDRRMYDYANQCFYFGYQAVDTAWVGGEIAEIRIREVPCYPYLQRRRISPAPESATLPVPRPVRPPASLPSGTGYTPSPDSAAPATSPPSPAPAIPEDSSRTRIPPKLPPP